MLAAIRITTQIRRHIATQPTTARFGQARRAITFSVGIEQTRRDELPQDAAPRAARIGSEHGAGVVLRFLSAQRCRHPGER